MQENLIYQNTVDRQDASGNAMVRTSESSTALDGRSVPLDVEVSQRPLSSEEKALLTPDLERRNLSVNMLDVLPPRSGTFYILRALTRDKQLVAITVLMNVYPFVALKNMLGEGNHVGWDISFYFTPNAPRADAIAALMKKVASRCMFYGVYFGLLDEDIFAALPKLRHRLFLTDYKAGVIPTTGLQSRDEYLKRHKRLRRNVKDFHKKGGTIHVHKGPVSEELAGAFAKCVHSTYSYHGRNERFDRFKKYAYEACTHFFMNCKDAVHIHGEIDGVVVGCQSFVQHTKHLELSEGGFLRDRKNHHVYEAIMTESVVYAIEHGLEHVSYGGIWNHTKDRYCCKESRQPIHALFVYDKWWKSKVFGEWFPRRTLLKSLGKQFGGGGSDFKLVSSR